MHSQPKISKIGDIFTISSNNYGLLTYITAAKVNFLHAEDLEDNLNFQHPKQAFSAFTTSSNPDCFKRPEDPSSQFAFFVSLPFVAANKNWWTENPNCLYRTRVKRKPRAAGSPVDVTLKDYNKWTSKNYKCLEFYMTVEEIDKLAQTIISMTSDELKSIQLDKSLEIDRKRISIP